MTRQLRQFVWWPGMTNDIKQFYQSCLGCSTAEPRNFRAPIIERKPPIGPWIDSSADYRELIAWKYSFRVLIDNYYRWPEVGVVNSTSFEDLRPALDRSVSLLGILALMTHGGRPTCQ